MICPECHDEIHEVLVQSLCEQSATLTEGFEQLVDNLL